MARKLSKQERTKIVQAARDMAKSGINTNPYPDSDPRRAAYATAWSKASRLTHPNGD